MSYVLYIKKQTKKLNLYYKLIWNLGLNNNIYLSMDGGRREIMLR